MMSVDYALRVYTNMLNAGENTDMDYFKSQLNQSDYDEFKSLTPFVNKIKSTKQSQKFDVLFKKVNAYKQSICDDLSCVSGFRADSSSDFEEAEKMINKLFDEEFGDE